MIKNIVLMAGVLLCTVGCQSARNSDKQSSSDAVAKDFLKNNRPEVIKMGGQDVLYIREFSFKGNSHSIEYSFFTLKDGKLVRIQVKK